MKNKRLILLSLCLLIFIDSIGGGLIFPLMPELFFDSTRGLIINHTLFFRNMMYGLSFALFPLAGFIGMPLFGVFSDKLGRRKIMLYGLVGISFGYFLSMVSIYTSDLYIFLLSRLIEGFFIGTYTVASAAISDISNNEVSKMNNFRWPMLISVLGFVLGPVMGSAVGLIQTREAFVIPFLIAFLLSLINLLTIYKLFPKYIKNTSDFKESYSASIFFIFINKKIKPLSISYLFFQFAMALLFQYLSIFLFQGYGYGTGKIGVFYITMSMALVIGMLAIQPKLMSFIKLDKIINYSFILVILIVFIETVSLIFIKSSIIFWTLMFVMFLFQPIISVGLVVSFSESVNEYDQGKVMAGSGQLASLGSLCSAILLGLLLNINSIVVFFMIFICLFISFYLFSLYKGVLDEVN